jgi:hypothetical protein
MAPVGMYYVLALLVDLEERELRLKLSPAAPSALSAR